MDLVIVILDVLLLMALISTVALGGRGRRFEDEMCDWLLELNGDEPENGQDSQDQEHCL